MAHRFNKFVKVRVPGQKYKAMVWSKAEMQFIDAQYDILEQRHYSNDRKEIVDYEIYIPTDLKPQEIYFVKIVATDEVRETPSAAADFNTNLSIEGFSKEGDAIFQYTNK